MIIDRISRELGLSNLAILNIVRSADHLYKFYTLNKRDGGKRPIYHPSKRLKVLQKWVAHRIFLRLPVHEAATAYIKGKSIKDNAYPHAENNFVQKIDFSNFFESITSTDVEWLLKKHQQELDLSQADINGVCKITCRRGQLTIGAPSSPAISNAVLYDFDLAVAEFAVQNGLVYTRYADDLTFSTNERDTVGTAVQFVRELTGRLQNPRLVINEQKLVSVSKKRKRTVTGLVLTTDGNVSIGRERKREIRALIHKYGTGNLDAEQQDYLRGMLAFLKSIEPATIERLKTKYGEGIIDELLAHADPTIQLYAN